ncbi:hypothetical protein PLESTB_000801000 [Pleodorina starrii]|uniref:Uncharacterized protein n=1 Tax=Pleodorina starrii TaxID=330485 RepID=A0A9W6F256_9CHLO|nr:hypothetical protein PLESTB_000801000 [Pleodorina starrii]GLC75421.1 hypothetical protein PLESTF_001635000 [Pleodorina starrii]
MADASAPMVATLTGGDLGAAQPHDGVLLDAELSVSRQAAAPGLPQRNKHQPRPVEPSSQPPQRQQPLQQQAQYVRHPPPPPPPPHHHHHHHQQDQNQEQEQQEAQQQEEQPQVLRVLDLYSGIGGMHHALLRLLERRQTLGAGAGAGGGPAGVQQGRQAGEGPQARQGAAPAGKHVQAAGLGLQVTAVDINTMANRVYAAELGVQPRTLDLQRVTAAQLDELAADLWLLTPPCQPYTTTSNARRRDTADPRAASLLHLLSGAVLGSMTRPPSRLLLENVPGFVGSGSHGALRGSLTAAGYELQEFVVSPHQLGVPYSRPRYFALAVRRPLRFPRSYDCSSGPVEHPPALAAPPPPLPAANSPPSRCTASAATTTAAATAASDTATPAAAGADAATCLSASPVSEVTFTATQWPGVYDAGRAVAPAPVEASPEPSASPVDANAAASNSETAATARPMPRPPALARYLTSAAPGSCVGQDEPRAGGGGGGGDGTDPWVSYAVPAAQLARFWRVLDVVTPSSTYCNCFTKHYADNLLGAGSVLASEDFAARFCARDSRGRLHFAAPPPLPASGLPQQQQPQAQPQAALPTQPSPVSPTGVGRCANGADVDAGAAAVSDRIPVADAGLPPAVSAAATTPVSTGSTDISASREGSDGGAPAEESVLENGGSCSGAVPVVWRQRPRGGGGGGGGRRGGLGQRGIAGDGGDTSTGTPGRNGPSAAAAAAVPVPTTATYAWPEQPQQQQPGQQGAERRQDPAADLPGQLAASKRQDDNAAETGAEAVAEAVVLGLRFFSPAEVAAIHGLPAGWAARAGGAGVHPRQQYGLLGNGLSTDVAAYLLAYLFEAQP